MEERRRTKTIPRFFNEKSCLKLVHATLTRAAATWQRIGITATERAQLDLIPGVEDRTGYRNEGGGRIGRGLRAGLTFAEISGLDLPYSRRVCLAI